MRQRLILFSGLFVAVFTAVGCALYRTNAADTVAPGAAADRLARAEERYHREVLPVLNQYCWDCHGDGMDKGDVSLDAFTNLTAVLQDRRLWERVMQTVRSGDMPPKKKKQPADEERSAVVAWIDTTLFPVDPDRPDPGRVTLRRLNRTEYNNTIRDLIGLDLRPADDFPQDDVGYGFDNIGDVLSLPPILWERYLRAAEMVLDEAIVSGPREPRTRRFTPRDLRGHNGNDALATMSSNGEMTLTVPVQFPGEYVLRVRAYGDQAGDERVRMAVRLDGRDLEEVEVRRGKNDPKFYEVRTAIEPGEHQVGIAFLNDFYEEQEVEVPRGNGRVRKEKRIRDRNLQVTAVEVVGPHSEGTPPLTDVHRRIFFRGHDGTDDPGAAREIIGRFAGRAFRRPVTPGELDRLVGLYREALDDGDNFEASVRHALTAVLVSPAFLFRGELQPDPDNPLEVRPVDEYALASRLSYFLWSTMPDDVLMDLAARGRLRRNLGAQVARMLRDPRSRALTENFAGQWLQLRKLEILAPDKAKFPDFDAELAASMRRETEQLFEAILFEDRPVTEFLTAEYTFLNGRLARHYGVDGVDGDGFVRVSMKGRGRSGVLTHGSILTLTSNPTRTSPVKRGLWVMDNILGTPPPPAPPGVPPLDEKELKGTLRERMEQHRNNPSCASCHERMDAIGFGFEHFDAIGRYRERDGEEPVEAQGSLSDAEAFADHLELNRLLASSRRGDFLRCLTEKLLTYALGRGLEYYDRPAVERIVRRLEENDLRMSELVRGVVDSVPFQLRRGEGDPFGTSSAP